MGNYYGGSTIVKYGNFQTYDPADERSGPASGSPVGKVVTRATASFVRKKADPEQKLKSARINLLHHIIQQVVRGRSEIELPRKFSEQLRAEIEKAGTAYSWAREQSSFETILARNLKKFKKKGGVSEAASDVPATTKRTRVLARRGARSSKAKKSPSNDRTALMNYLIDQMVARQGALALPKLNTELAEAVGAAGSPLEWLKAQSDYESLFKAGLLRAQVLRTASPAKQGKKSGPSKKRIKSRVQKRPQIVGEIEKAPRVVKPIVDVPVSFILGQIKKSSDEALDIRRIDWGAT